MLALGFSEQLCVLYLMIVILLKEPHISVAQHCQVALPSTHMT